MTKYKDIVGTAVRNNAGNLSTAEKGQVWFDSTNLDFKYLFAAQIASWRTTGSLNTARYVAGANVGTSSTEGLCFGGVGPIAVTEDWNGSTDDLTISTERAANTLVFTDSTQGWLLKNN